MAVNRVTINVDGRDLPARLNPYTGLYETEPIVEDRDDQYLTKVTAEDLAGNVAVEIRLLSLEAGELAEAVVRHSKTNEPLVDVVIEVFHNHSYGKADEIHSRSDGTFILALPKGTYIIRLSKDTFEPFTISNYQVLNGLNVFEEGGPVEVRHRLLRSANSPIVDAFVSVINDAGRIVAGTKTDANGWWVVHLPEGFYTFKFIQYGFDTVIKEGVKVYV